MKGQSIILFALSSCIWTDGTFIASTQQSFSKKTALAMAGFGAKKGTGGKNKMKTLKPKQQWDRYGEYAKKSKNVEVGVRVLGEDEAEWLSVGFVNTKENKDGGLSLAVSRQRSIIADHAKRLHPLSISAKDKIEWGYKLDESWITAEAVNEFPKNFEKDIGFEGIGDPKR